MNVSEENKFSFEGETMTKQLGHIANMTNQLAMILKELRTEALGYQADHGVNELRRCPHCNLIWAKVEGCNGQTTCGSVPSRLDARDPNYCILGTFSFRWDGRKLTITKGGQK